MQQGIQASPALLHERVIIDQQYQPHRSKRVLHEKLDSTAQAENARFAAWQDRVSQLLQYLREMYLPKVIKMIKSYERAQELCLQPPNSELAQTYEKNILIMERISNFLILPLDDVAHYSKDELKEIFKYIASIFERNRVSMQHRKQHQMSSDQSQTSDLQQQRSTKLQFYPLNPNLVTPPIGSPQYSMQIGIPISQPDMIHSGSLAQLEGRNAMSPMPHSFAQAKPIYQNTGTRPPLANTITSLRCGFTSGLEQRNYLSTLDHGHATSVQNSMSTPQQTNSSHETTVNELDPTIISLSSNCSILPIQQMRQQPKHRIKQRKKLKQPMQQPFIEQKGNQKLMQKKSEGNESNVKAAVGFSSGVLQQCHAIDQHAGYSPQPQLQSTQSQLLFAFSQPSQQSFPHIDQEDLQFPPYRAGAMLQSAPSLSMIPSSIGLDTEKQSFGASPVSIAENMKHPSIQLVLSQLQSETRSKSRFLATSAPVIAASPLLTKFVLEGSQKLHVAGQPIDRLLEAVNSASPKALSASMRDIEEVSSMIDSIDEATTSRGESRATVVKHLVADTSYLQYGSSSANRMKRHINAVAINGSSSSSDDSDNSKSTATSKTKRPRIETNDALLDEIKEINQQLIETMIDVVVGSDYSARAGPAEDGTLIVCSYTALGIRENFKLHCATSKMMSTLAVYLLVPTDYPKVSPIILDCSSVGQSGESAALWEKAKLRFDTSVREISDPMSLGEMARIWDVCGRAVLLEYAQQMGGGCFRSRYGLWENCIAASS